MTYSWGDMALNETNTTISWATEDATLGLGLIFCILLLMIGFKEKTFWILAGPVWILCGMTIFLPYGEAFLVMSVGIGLVLLFEGVMHIA
jgi:hypothetical protein